MQVQFGEVNLRVLPAICASKREYCTLIGELLYLDHYKQTPFIECMPECMVKPELSSSSEGVFSESG